MPTVIKIDLNKLPQYLLVFVYIKVSSLLDNAPNYLVWCVIPKEMLLNLPPMSVATATAAARNSTTTVIQTTDLQLLCRISRLSLVT